MQLFGALYNWTDDLPKCEHSGVAYETNQDYSLGDGYVALNDYEDRSFHFQCPDECYLYGVIDGHNGSKVANFAAQKLPAELLLGQLKDEFTDEDVKTQLNDSFECLSRAVVDDLINDSLMEKIKLEAQLEGLDRAEAALKYPTMFKELEQLDNDIAGGCSAVITLIHKGKLFVANVGDTRALLCCGDESTGGGGLSLVQLSVDHTISTMAELQRLANLGIDIEKVQYSGCFDKTRSIGDWSLKGGYKNNEILNAAKSEPILSTPSIHGGRKMDTQMKFLVMMSKGVYKAYEEATGVKPNMVNNRIASMVHQEIMKQTRVSDVAQAVIDEIGTLHYDQYLTSQKQKCMRRDDMTILIRLFNIELGGQQRNMGVALPATTHTSKLLQKSAKLPPLKIPEPTSKIVDMDSPSSTGSNTPTTATVTGEFCRTPPPGSGESGDCETVTSDFSPPPFSDPLSPLASTVKANPNYEPLQVLVDEEFSPANCAMIPELSIKPRGIKESMRAAPCMLKRSGIYPPLKLQRDGCLDDSDDSRNIKRASSDGLKMLKERDDQLVANTNYLPNEDKTRLFNRPPEALETDDEGRIKGYVDFAEFTKRIDELGGEQAVFGDLINILL